MATSIAPAAPATPTADAPTTLAAVAPTLAEQLYTTPPVEPTAAPAAVVPDPAVPAAEPEAPAGDAPEYIQGEDGQWRRADGTFATSDELAQIEAQLTETEKAKADAEANRAATIVPIRGRNGEMVEVETPDEETAQLLRQNVNDGMRRRDFMEAQAAIDARASIVQRAEQIIQHNPEGFVQENLNDEQQVRLGAMLLARHFDTLAEIIRQYDMDPSSRIAAVAQSQLRIKQQMDDFQTHSVTQESAKALQQAVAKMIPDTADQADVDEFWQIASVLCSNAVDRGQPVTPDTVSRILAGPLQKYGFAEAAPAAPKRPRITLATRTAPSVAAPAATPSPAPASQQQNQQRLRLVQQRRNAAAIPPHGRGGFAKPVVSPVDREFQNAANLLYGGTTRA